MVNKLLSKTKLAELAGVSRAAITKACKDGGQLRDAVAGKSVNVAHPAVIRYLESRELAQAEPVATGIDPLYEHAVEFCKANNRYSMSGIQRELKIGYTRAARIIEMMKIANLIPAPGAPAPDPAPVVITPKPHIRGTAALKEKRKRESKPLTEDDLLEFPEDIETFLDWTLRELIKKFGTDYRFTDWLSATQKIEAINEKRLKNAQTKGSLISRELVQGSVIDVFNSAHLRLLKDGARSIAGGVIAKHASGASQTEVEAYISDILGSFISPIKSKITRSLKNA